MKDFCVPNGVSQHELVSSKSHKKREFTADKIVTYPMLRIYILLSSRCSKWCFPNSQIVYLIFIRNLWSQLSLDPGSPSLLAAKNTCVQMVSVQGQDPQQDKGSKF